MEFREKKRGMKSDPVANLSLRLALFFLQRVLKSPWFKTRSKKADLLIEAMGWIRQFREKITVIKLGAA